MPIANCLVKRDIYESVACERSVVEIWSSHSGVKPDYMTVNFIELLGQHGCAYEVMANLYLPSLWSNSDIGKLQVSLAKALAEYFKTDPGKVHVITQVVGSGMVVENGEIAEW